MSSEFTIDIQLTELGFPELFQDEARPKEAPSLPCPDDASCAPLTPPNSQTASPPSQDLIPDSVAGGHVVPVASKPTEAHTCAPAQTVVPQSGQNKDQANPVAVVADRRRSGAGANAQRKDAEHNVSAAIVKKAEAAAGLGNARAGGGIGEGKSSGGDGGGGSGRGGMESGVNASKKRPAAEAEKDSEESDDSDVSEASEDEDEEEDDEEDDLASDASSADGPAERTCRACGLTLPSAFQLREHMHVHSGARPYRCSECGKQFCHLANYRAHLRGHAQTSAAAFRCRVCEAPFETAESLAHHLENSHFEKEFYQCDFCKRIFTCLNECQRHVVAHQRAPRRHQCPQCERHFRRRRTLARHLARHSAKRSYLCTDCGQAFERKNVLFRHSFSHLGLLPYTCVRCRRHFRLASLYRKHACEPQRIQCEACLGFFRSQTDFQRHKEETGCWGRQAAAAGGAARARGVGGEEGGGGSGGGGGGGVRCMECGQAFRSAEELREHGSAHQRVLTCSECGKGFRSALLLMSHMGGHAGQRPCLCQRCGLGFPHQQGYDSHRKLCGRPPPAPVASKKQKKEAPPPEKADVSASQGVWKLTLDKRPPPGTSLVMFLPVPADPSSPGLAEFAASTLPVAYLPAKEPQKTPTPAPALQVVMAPGSAPKVPDPPSAPPPRPGAAAGPATAASAAPGPPSEALCQESLPVPGTTLKLQISKATFVPGPQGKLQETWEQSGIPGGGGGPQPPGAPLSDGPTAGPLNPAPVTMQIVGPPGAGGLFGSAAAGGAPSTRDQISVEGRNWTMALKEERVEEAVKKGRGNEVAATEVKGPRGAEAGTGAVGQAEGGETRKPVYVKIELPSRAGSGIPSGSSEARGGAAARVPGWAGPEGSGSGQRGPRGPGGTPALQVKREAAADDGADAERESREAPGSGTTTATRTTTAVVEDDYGGWVYDSVEVEIRDEETEGDQEANGDLHECVNCGKILLEGDMVQHYMQHAVESDSPLQDCSTETQPLSTPSPPIPSLYTSPSVSPPLSPPTKRELRPRKKP